MRLLDYTADSGILPRLECQDRTEVIRLLVDGLVSAGSVSEPEKLVEEILRREAEGSTAIGGGLTIPHTRYALAERVQIAVATLATPLIIPADDDQPVDVVILIVGPRGDPRQMLRILARLARLVKHDDFLATLRAADTADEILAAIGDAERRYA